MLTLAEPLVIVDGCLVRRRRTTSRPRSGWSMSADVRSRSGGIDGAPTADGTAVIANARTEVHLAAPTVDLVSLGDDWPAVVQCGITIS
jgi:hypothetical protein